MLLNAAKCQGYSFYCFWIIQGKPRGSVKLNALLLRQSQTPAVTILVNVMSLSTPPFLHQKKRKKSLLLKQMFTRMHFHKDSFLDSLSVDNGQHSTAVIEVLVPIIICVFLVVPVPVAVAYLRKWLCFESKLHSY